MRSLLLNLTTLSAAVLLSISSLYSQSHETTPQTTVESTPLEEAISNNLQEDQKELSEQEVLLNQMFDAVTAGNAEEVEQMIDDGKVDYYRHNETGETALTQAIVNKDAKLVKLLVKEAIINLKNEAGETPLTLAIKQGNMGIIRLVMRRAKASLKNNTGEAPLFLALEMNDLHLLNQLIKNGADVNRLSNGKSPISYAVELNQYKSVGYLVRNGAAINQLNEDGTIPLYVAIANGYDVIAGILINKSQDAFNDVNWRNDIGDPLLHIAAKNGNTELVRMLIEAGASVSEFDHEENTPLHIAASHGNNEAVTLIMTYDTDINYRNLLGATPLMMAAANGHQATYDMLLEYGANPKIKDYMGDLAIDYFNHKSGSLSTKKVESRWASQKER